MNLPHYDAAIGSSVAIVWLAIDDHAISYPSIQLESGQLDSMRSVQATGQQPNCNLQHDWCSLME
jgi:hypothetical protein